MLIATVAQPVTAQVDCEWQSGCQDPWVPQTYNILIPILTTPPCSFSMQVFVKQRCEQIEIQDMGYGILVLDPPGCATVQQVMDLWSSGFMKEGIYKGVVNAYMQSYLAANPTCCPCPIQKTITVAKVARCFKLILSYKIQDLADPNGYQIVSQWYDLTKPWSFYETQMLIAGGTEAVISWEACPGTGGCKRQRSLCIQDGVAIYSDGPWQSYGECTYNPEGQCQVLFCD